MATIVVNSRPKVVNSNTVNYDELVRLAGFEVGPSGEMLYKVTYTHGPEAQPEGMVALGQSVRIIDGMQFNVSPTGRS